MDLKTNIFLELNRKQRSSLLKTVDFENCSLEDISTIDLPFIAVSYLNASLYDSWNNKQEAIDSYNEYNYLVESLGVVVPFCVSTREDKIKVYSKKKSFSYHFIDWEDRDWLMKLLEYFYILSCESLNFLKHELKLKDEHEHEHKQEHEHKHKQEHKQEHEHKHAYPLKTYKIDNPPLYEEGVVKECLAKHQHVENNFILPEVKFNRKDLLRRRINPKYSLEEFGDVLVERLEILKNLEKPLKINLEEENRISLEELRKQDEEKDDRHIQKGNTKNVG
ncbi:hypothetical protein NGRA_1394 [Nosema granulosis]|uniref:Uncharacterized protein n=1 Tax=Nosema granulosis TaxID=83296 RepID=A0A9P6GYJ7_9MICR|nr:hypothetical protein NGRA_1394 [Nosema granulosis]